MNETFGLLYATPSFLEGVARILDIGNTFTTYNTFADAREADFLALRSDWRAIGEDFENALAEYEDNERTSTSSREGSVMAPTLTPETETHLRTVTQERNLELTDVREDVPAQGSAEWEKRLWSLGQHSHSVPLSPDATSREVIYEDAAL